MTQTPASFTLDGARLFAALDAVRPVIYTRAIDRIQLCVRITGTDTGLRFTGTNGETFLTHVIDGNFPRFDVAVQYHDLHSFLKAMRWSGFTIEAGDALFRLKDFLFAAGDGAQFAAVSPSLFPAIPQREWNGETEIAPEILRQVRPAISTEETRYYLNGMYLEANDNNLRCVATDGHRLIVRNTQTPFTGPAMLVPTEVIKWMCGRNAPIHISGSTDGAFARIREGETTVIARLIDGKFLNYRRVIPTGGQKSLTLDRTDFARLIDAANSQRRSRTPYLAIEFSDHHATIRSGGETSSVALSLPVQTQDDLPARIGFNGLYLRTALRLCASESVTLQIVDENSPIVITEGDLSQIIMPSRV